MDVASESLESAVSTAVEGLIPVLSKCVEPPSGEHSWQRPTPDQIQDACNAAMEYKVAVKKQEGGQGTKPSAIRYFAFLPEVDVVELVEDVLGSVATNAESNAYSNSSVGIRSFWTSLKSSSRITRRPHITITHKQNLPDQQLLWDSCMAVEAIKASPALFEFRLGTLLCDGKVMSIVVDDLRLLPPSTATSASPAAAPTRSIEKADSQTLQNAGTHLNFLEESQQQATATKAAAEKLLKDIPKALKARFHITIGTRNDDIKPFEGGKLVERWKAAGAGAKDIISVPIVEKRVVGRVRGLFG